MTTNSTGVTLAKDGAVGIVTFERPPLNYFNVPLIEALADACDAIDAAPELRVILLRSTGKVFCAGAQFAGTEGTGGGTLADPGELYRKAVRLFRTRKPIIVAVQGAAIGGGLGLALVGDFRVAADEARFSGNFVRIGIHPGFGLTYTLPRAVGSQQSALLLYTGRRIDGKEAVRIGLADVSVPLDQLHETSLALAREIAESAPLAVESTRATLRTGLADAVAAQTERELREQKRLFATEDFKEGVRAVAERRSAHWARA